MATANRDAAVARLRQNFGHQIDKEVLESVLEITNNDVNAAIAFLTAEEGGYAFDPAQQNNGAPADYPGQTKYVGYGANKTNTEEQEDASPEIRIKNLFIQESTYQEHYDAQNKHYNTYTAIVLLFSKFNVEISKGAKNRMLAAAWARHDYVLADYLLAQEENFNLPQVLGALNLLDAGRKVRAINKRVEKLTEKGGAKPKTITKLKSNIHDLNKEAHLGSLSGALAKKIRKWVKRIPAEKLTFFALNLPKAPWRELADLIHLNPKKDFQCAFLEIAFDSEPAPGSMLAECSKIDADNCVEISKKWHVPYSYLRLQVKPLPPAAKEAVATYAPLDTLIWFHEELTCAPVDKIIGERLRNGEQPKFGYGKLMERLLYLKRVGSPFYQYLEPIADRTLSRLHLALESPVAVLGDASYSMDVAIRCATIIGSVLTLLTNADLKFFHSLCFDPVVVPRTVAQVLTVATDTKADGLTAPACALASYYQQKKVVKFFVLVTDEIENEKFEGSYFPDLFLKYHKEVYPARIVFVSFLENPSEKGRMVKALENMGIVPLLYRLDGNRPDLQKLDSLLGLLACESSSFVAEIRDIAKDVEARGFARVSAALSTTTSTTTTTTTPTTTTTTTPTTTSADTTTAAPHPAATNDNSNNQPTSTNAQPTTTTQQTNAQPTAVANKEVTQFLHEERDRAEKRAQVKSADKPNNPSSCVVCEERPVSMVLIECGHLALCEGCAPAIVARNECPLCRAPVQRALKTFQGV